MTTLVKRIGAALVMVGGTAALYFGYDPSRLADENVEPIERTLSSELVEIDEDLAEAIELLDEARADALWDVPWAFENHWGQHALACLRPLHQLVTYGAV